LPPWAVSHRLPSAARRVSAERSGEAHFRR